MIDVIVNSSRSRSSNRGEMFYVCTKNGFRSDGLFFIGRGMFKIASGWSISSIGGQCFAVVTSGRNFVTFAFRSGDGNFFLLGWQMV